MPKIFWVICPRCQGKFYAHHGDFRGTMRQLICPYCNAKFTDKEAKEIIE